MTRYLIFLLMMSLVLSSILMHGDTVQAAPDAYYLRDASDANACGLGTDEEDLSLTQGSSNVVKSLTTTGHSWWYQFGADTTRQVGDYTVTFRGDHSGAGGSPSNRILTMLLRRMDSSCAEQEILVSTTCTPNKGQQDWTCSGTQSLGAVTFVTGDYLLLEITAAANGHNTLQYNGTGAPYDSFVSIPAAAVAVSVTLTTDGTIAYGTLATGASRDTIDLSDTQTVTNDGDVTETFNIKGQDTSCPWTLSASAGTDQYIHEFSTNDGSNWTALTTSYQALATGIAASGTQDVDVRITVPTESSCFTQQSVDVIIQAVQE